MAALEALPSPSCEVNLLEDMFADLEDECFTKGTAVEMADGTSKAIEDVKPGDQVLTRPSKRNEDAPTEQGTVARTFSHVSGGTLLVRFADGGTVQTTEGHRLYVRGKGFTPAGELRAGDMVAEDGKGLDRVAALVRLGAPERVYNFEVAGDHTYFVGTGDAWLWVHNACGDWTATLGEGDLIHPQHGRFYRSGDMYFTRDNAGHGGSKWKFYEFEDNSMVHEFDADEFGTKIPGKHKGPVGRRIPGNQFRGI